MQPAASRKRRTTQTMHDGRTTAALSAILPKSNSLNFIIFIIVVSVSSSEQQRWQQAEATSAGEGGDLAH
jgi:hypothetical protein